MSARHALPVQGMKDVEFKTTYPGPWASPATPTRVKTGDWRYQRPVVKTAKCCHCGSCYLFCPTGCVVDQGSHFAADLDYCKGCGICARQCPGSAIMMVRE